MNGVQRASRKADQRITKELDNIYPAVTVIMWEEYGWRRTRIERFFKKTDEVWKECADAGVEKSMLSMLEEETGIEIKMPGMKSFHEYAYLDANAWDRKPPTEKQVLYIRQQQIKWIPAMVVGGMCLALYRKEKWGAERVARFVSLLEQKKAEYGTNRKLYAKELEEKTDFTAEEVRRHE